jgi:hypothetical protein
VRPETEQPKAGAVSIMCVIWITPLAIILLSVLCVVFTSETPHPLSWKGISSSLWLQCEELIGCVEFGRFKHCTLCMYLTVAVVSITQSQCTRFNCGVFAEANHCVTVVSKLCSSRKFQHFDKYSVKTSRIGWGRKRSNQKQAPCLSCVSYGYHHSHLYTPLTVLHQWCSNPNTSHPL